MRGGVKLALVFWMLFSVGLTTSAQTQTGAATPDPNSGSAYVVQPGDRLWDIARQFGVDMRCLVRVNMLANQNLIRRGQALDIGSCVGQGGGAVPLPVSQQYTVQPGDHLTNIAAMFGIDVNCLISSNSFSNPNYIRPDQIISIDFSRCAAG